MCASADWFSPKMPSCALKSCSNHSRRFNKNQGVTYHRFLRPGHAKREQWIRYVQLNRNEYKWMPSEHSNICSNHFRDEDKYVTKTGRVFLTEGAVPFNKDTPSSELEIDNKSLLDIQSEIAFRKKLQPESNSL